MQCNIGLKERNVRVVIGLLLIGIAALSPMPEWGSLVALGVGAVAVVTGLVRFCPLWKVLGMNTCGNDTDQGHSNT